MWTREHYIYTNAPEEYTTPKLDSLYSKITTDIINATETIRNTGSIMEYGANALKSYDGGTSGTVSESTRAVTLTAGGITLWNRNSETNEWESHNIWTTEGLNLDKINVMGLTANEIKDGILAVNEIHVVNDEEEEEISLDDKEFKFNHNGGYVTSLSDDIEHAIEATYNDTTILKADYAKKEIIVNDFTVETKKEKTERIEINNIAMFSSNNPETNKTGLKIMGI